MYPGLLSLSYMKERLARTGIVSSVKAILLTKSQDMSQKAEGHSLITRPIYPYRMLFIGALWTLLITALLMQVSGLTGLLEGP